MNHELLLLLLTASTSIANSIRQEVKAPAGGSVTLRCSVNQASCGDFHSIKWYKENRRVFVYSPLVEFSKAEGELLDRAQLTVNSREALLSISPVMTTDEGEYKCEITFLDISKNCPVVQLVKLTTLKEPDFVNISLSSGGGSRPLLANSVVGPFMEGSELLLVCESGGGKPIPRVSWYLEGNQLPGKASSAENPDRTGIGRSEVSLLVERKQLGTKLQCSAENEALSSPKTASVQLDVSLRPSSVRISGGESPVTAGIQLGLTCHVGGARPAAVITWFNGSLPFPAQPAGQVALQADGTYTTNSTLIIEVNRFHDNTRVFCEAKNEVVEFYDEPAVKADLRLSVLYPPVVSNQPANLTVNTSLTAVLPCPYQSNPVRLTRVRWFKDGQPVVVAGADRRYEGGTVNQPGLTVREVSRLDTGSYTCVLDNGVGGGGGSSSSQQPIYLDVLYRPVVRLRMEPDTGVSETKNRTVSLYCDLVEGNPTEFTHVTWYKDSQQIKEIPRCNHEDPNCDIDPSVLLLENVNRQFHGNYSCVGVTSAGQSEMSASETLSVLYPPGKAVIQTDTDEVEKGGQLYLKCVVEDVGRPAAQDFIWTRGGHQLRGVNSATWLINPVTIETQSDISCQAVNIVGEGEKDTISIKVNAPPNFIISLHPYTGFTAKSRNVSLLCQVECAPLCQISWLKDGIPLPTSGDYYSIKTLQVPPNYSKNDFQSVKSELMFNLENWPQGQLSRHEDNANYTCRSTPNLAGPGVHSSTHVRVEYPPDTPFLSQESLRVVEGELPERVSCSSQAYPEASYVWRYDNQMVATHNLLYFGAAVTRKQAGTYVCEAQNRHGKAHARMKLEVLYRPECKISQQKLEDGIRLTCEADSRPREVDFQWKLGNSTFSGPITSDGTRSSIMLSFEQDPPYHGTFVCVVNNTVGLGVPCEIDIQGIEVLKSMSDTNVIVIVGVIVAGLLTAVVIAVTVILCKRRNAGEKFVGKSLKKSNDMAGSLMSGGQTNGTIVNSSASSNSVANNMAANNQTNGQPVHKWPLRPGVHVHVNGLTALTGNKGDHQIEGFTYGAKPTRSPSSTDSDWASNASSYPDSNSDSSGGKRGLSVGKNNNNSSCRGTAIANSISKGDDLGGQSSASSNSSRPSSRLKKIKNRQASSALNHQVESQEDSMGNRPPDPSERLMAGSAASKLPSFYENVSEAIKMKSNQGGNLHPASQRQSKVNLLKLCDNNNMTIAEAGGGLGVMGVIGPDEGGKSVGTRQSVSRHNSGNGSASTNTTSVGSAASSSSVMMLSSRIADPHHASRASSQPPAGDDRQGLHHHHTLQHPFGGSARSSARSRRSASPTCGGGGHPNVMADNILRYHGPLAGKEGVVAGGKFSTLHPRIAPHVDAGSYGPGGDRRSRPLHNNKDRSHPILNGVIDDEQDFGEEESGEDDYGVAAHLPSQLGQERNLLIEYSNHQPYSKFTQAGQSRHQPVYHQQQVYSATPILSSLNQLHASLGQNAGPLPTSARKYGGSAAGSQPHFHHHHHLQQQQGLDGAAMMTGPISPPKQFDSSSLVQIKKSGRD